jgi:hypothetical protein
MIDLPPLQYSLTRGIRQKPCEGAETEPQAKFREETIARAHRRPKWVPHYGVQADSGRGQDAQALLRLCSGMLTLSPG